MEAYYAGWLSILPPIIAIVLALVTKEVLTSLMCGILTGTLIYTVGVGLNPIVGTVETAFNVMVDKADLNILIFCCLLGALVFVVSAALTGGGRRPRSAIRSWRFSPPARWERSFSSMITLTVSLLERL